MPAIRWLGLYGMLRANSFDWELTQTEREVAAEWTVKGRPFVAAGNYSKAQSGLLVKYSAIIKKQKCDAYTSINYSGHLVWRRKHKTLDPNLFSDHIWEAVCYPQYVGIVVTEACKNAVLSMAIDAAAKYKMPLLMYQVVKNSDTGEQYLLTEI